MAITFKGKPISHGLTIGLAGALLIGCSPTRLVEQGIEKELPQYVGPAEHYDVDIDGLNIVAGTASSVVAVGDRVHPEGAPVIDRLELELKEITYDRNSEKLTKVESAQLTAVIKTPDLVDFLEAYRNVQEADITLYSPNQATLRIRPQIGDYSIPQGITVDVSGELIGDGTQLRFDVYEVRAAGINISNLTATRLSNLINPLADLNNLPIQVDISSVIVAGETIGLEVVGDPTSFSM